MSDFVKEFIAIEDCFNEKTRSFINSVQNDGITWIKYESQEELLNQYYYSIRSIFLKYKPDFISMLISEDGENRLISLKLIRDGLLDFSLSDFIVEKLIYISIIGNDEEKKLARNLIIFRKWLSTRDELVRGVIFDFYKKNIDYYTYKDISEFLFIIKNESLLGKHIELGMNSQDEEIIELANELKIKAIPLIG